MKWLGFCCIYLFFAACAPNIMGSFGQFTQFANQESIGKFFEVQEVVIQEKSFNNTEAKQ